MIPINTYVSVKFIYITARANGSVGGEITNRLVQMVEQRFSGFSR